MENRRLILIVAAFVVAAALVWWLTRGTPTAVAPAVSPPADESVVDEPAADDAVSPRAIASTGRSEARRATPRRAAAEIEGGAALLIRVVNDATGAAVLDYQAQWSAAEYAGNNPDAQRARLTRSDAEGTLRVPVPAGRAISLIVSAEDYTPLTMQVAALSEGETREVVVRLDGGVLVTVRVLDTAGVPLAGAEVAYILDVPLAVASADTVFTFTPLGQTDERGELSVRFSGDTELKLRAQHSDYLEAIKSFDPSNNRPPVVEFFLQRPGSVAGVVTAGGAPVSGARVVAEIFVNDSKAKQTETDSEGRFEIAGLVEGEYQVSVSWVADPVAGDRRRLEQYAVVAENMVTELQFDFPELSSLIMGRIELKGEAPNSASMEITVHTEGGQQAFHSAVNADGRYEEAIPAGVAEVRVRANFNDGSARARASTLQVGPGQTVQHDVVFGAAYTVNGTINGIGAGEVAMIVAIAGDEPVRLSYEDLLLSSRRMVGEADVPAGGAFEIPNIEAGEYTIVVVVYADESLPEGVSSVEETMRFQQQRLRVGEDTPAVHFAF